MTPVPRPNVPGAQRSAHARPPSRRRGGPLTAEAAPRPGGQQALLAEARSRPGTPVPGKVQEGAKAPSWFPPPAERTQIIFRRGVYVTKNTPQAASVENGRPVGAAIFRVRSA